MTAAYPVQFEHLGTALGIGTSRPRMSWRLPTAGRRQTAYELAVQRSTGRATTGRISGDEHILVDWPWEALRSREQAAVQVRTWTDDDGAPSEWSEPTPVEAGLLSPDDWVAVPVGPSWPEQASTDRRPAVVRRLFTIERSVVAARLYVSAHGLFEAEVNGARVGREALAPGWTVYGSRLRYFTYDVTAHLHSGQNELFAWLGDGWYRGRLGFNGGVRDLYGADQALIAQLEIAHGDGALTRIATDSSWQAALGPIMLSGLYDGETFDARITPGGWTPVTVGERDPSTLFAPVGPPVRCTQEVTPVSITALSDQVHRIDFGQNLVGRLSIDVPVAGSAAGQSAPITIRHAEVLENGELATRPLRQAKATDTYIPSCDARPQSWEPRFTMHGFRYADVTGWPGRLDASAIRARVYHSDMRRTGWWESSDAKLNRLHDNVVWSMRGNFVDIPTDCPARDERLGWTGDLQVFAPTARFLYDCTGFIDSWLTDVAVEQLPDGTVPWYVPVVPLDSMWTPIRPGAAWGDVVALTPWLLYERTGDLDLLRRHLPAARRWVDLVARLAGPDRLWDSGFQLGDWLDPAAPPEDPAAGLTDKYLVATAYFSWSARHVALMAGALGDEAVRVHYWSLAEDVAAAFRRRWLDSDGRLISSESATAYALAIRFDLLAPHTRQRAGSRLAEIVRANGARITTGFVGTPLICDALTDTGQLDAAYELLMQDQCPSWLYPVSMGATTIWERWDSMLPDGRVNPGHMTSFNHYALGSVADWLHRVVGGLAPLDPGYRRIRFAPRPGGGLSWVRTAHDTPYGRASIAWELIDARLTVNIAVPPGTSGAAELPGGVNRDIGPGEHSFQVFMPETSAVGR